MIVLRVRNVHEGLRVALLELLKVGVRRPSRNGEVLQFPEPVTTVYERPRERVLFWPERDANPFLHFAESLWMLAGRNDLAFMTYFAKSFEKFSDDGYTLNGAYGYRWRFHFLRDQLPTIIEALRANKEDRRQVLQMWDGHEDGSNQATKADVPCNTAAYFSIDPVTGRLDMLVTNRSNDIVWGAYGANAVHFSYLQEFIAHAVGVRQGIYRQVSNNLHLYLNSQATKVLEIIGQTGAVNPYQELQNQYPGWEVTPEMMPNGVGSEYAEWLSDCEHFVSRPEGVLAPGMRYFFRRIAYPIFQAHAAYKSADGNRLSQIDSARHIVESCTDPAWAKACDEWLLRRRQSAILKAETEAKSADPN